MELTKYQELKAPSFEGANKITPQIRLVIDLIKGSINNNKPITRSDIINSYIEWKLLSKHKLRLEKFSHREPRYNEYLQRITDHSVYRYIDVSREEYANSYRCNRASRQWFKNNLAAAIIKGKLLVIPIIEID